MAATLLTKAPSFHSLNGRQAVGARQVAVATDYVGAVTVLYRAADEYWTVVTRAARNAFTTNSQVGATAAIWFDRAEGRYVVDYCDRDGVRVEAGRARGLGAAIGIACSTTTHQWGQGPSWTW
jgi:hypothetical protein